MAAPEWLKGTERKICKWCGRDHFNDGTMECDNCWEMRTRIDRRPDLAMKMLQSIGFVVDVSSKNMEEPNG